MVGVVFFGMVGMVAMVAAVTLPQLLDVVRCSGCSCSCSCSCSVVEL